MYTEAVIEFLELKIAVLRVAYSIGEWAMKICIFSSILLVHLYSVKKMLTPVWLVCLSVVPGLVLYVLLLLNVGPSG